MVRPTMGDSPRVNDVVRLPRHVEEVVLAASEVDADASRQQSGASPESALEPISPPLLVFRDVATLRTHPGYLKLFGRISVGNSEQSSRRIAAPLEPLVIARDGTIVDGHKRWRSAVEQGQLRIQCLEYNLTDEESLRMVIACHSRSGQLNAFCRVTLALGLESSLREAALERSSSGSNAPHSPSLTKRRLDVRREIASLAGVSTGNVTKVKQLLNAAIPEILKALCEGAVSIHRAWSWCGWPARRQRDALWAHQNRADIDHTIRRLIARHSQEQSDGSTVTDSKVVLDRLSKEENLVMHVVDVPGRAVVVTRQLYADLVGEITS